MPPTGYPPQGHPPQGGTPAPPPPPHGMPPYGTPPAPGYPPPPGAQPPPGMGHPGAPPGRYGPPQPRGPMPPGGPLRYAQPPRRRKGGAGVAIVGILGCLALIFIVVVVLGALLRGSRSPHSVSPISLPTFTPPAFTPPPFTHGTGDDRDETDRTPASQQSTQPATREPTTRETTTRPSPDRSNAARVVNRSLKNNTMYKMGRLPSVTCRAGSVSIYSHRQLKALILKTGKCLTQEWRKGLEPLGFRVTAPSYAIVSGRGRGACGDFPQRGSIVPYYCPRTTTIYASTSAMAKGSGNAIGYGQLTSWHGGIISMMAHEYGHHVQYLTGLSDSWWRRTLASGSQSAKLGLSRRFELQATCFGAMFMRSVASTYPVTSSGRAILYNFYAHVGDWPGYPRDHGSPANNNRWFHRGFDNNAARRCNTWEAASSAVS